MLKAVAVVLLAFGLCAIEPLVNPNLALEAAQPIASLVEITEEIKNDLLDPLEELAKENPEEPQLKELSEEMKELMEKLLDTTTEPKEMLARFLKWSRPCKRR